MFFSKLIDFFLYVYRGSIMKFLKDLRQGNESLARTFWIFDIFFNLCFSIVLKAISSPTNLVIFLILFLIYSINLYIGEWRAANKYEGLKLWSFLVKFRISLTVGILMAGLLFWTI